jgi:sulfur carrier protein
MEVVINGARRTVAATAATVADIVRDLGLEGKRIAVEKNGEIVPKSRYGDTAIRPDDRLEIVGAVGGG